MELISSNFGRKPVTLRNGGFQRGRMQILPLLVARANLLRVERNQTEKIPRVSAWGILLENSL